MKRLRLIDGLRDFDKDSVPSKSFIKKLSYAVTAELTKLVDEKYKSKITDILELSFHEHPLDYDLVPDNLPIRKTATGTIGPSFSMVKKDPADITRPLNEVCLGVEIKNTIHGLFTFIVSWKKKDSDDIVLPHDDVTDIDLEFDVNIPDSKVADMNYCIPIYYSPVVKSGESGLPYDYQIKCLEECGDLVFTFNTEISQSDADALERVLNEFAVNHNNTSSDIIHYIGDMEFKKNRAKVFFDGGISGDIIKNCIYAFSSFTFIKKIEYK